MHGTRSRIDGSLVKQLADAGISFDDALSLRKISMTLHRWHELECGDGNQWASWCITRGYETNMPGYWHKFNPWADKIVYVPLVELAHCAAPGGLIREGDKDYVFDYKYILKHWQQCGRDKLDGYILPQPSGQHSLGVRYGSKAEAYYSPHNAHPDKTENLLARYKDWQPTKGFMYDDDGKPYIEKHLHSENFARYTRIADRENGAKRRLARIMAKYPALRPYIQTDPRGCALYILPPGVTEDNYSCGIAVYK